MAAKGKYQGITVDIEFRGNPSKFNEAVNQVENGLKDIDTQLGRVNRDLKLDPTNATLVSRRFELLGEKVKATQEKLKMLKDAQSQVEQAFARGEVDKGAYRDLQREIARTESQLKNLNTEIQNTVRAVTADLRKAVSDLKTEFEGAASVIKKAELALVAFSAASAKTGADFESAMSQVAATMGIDKLSAEYEKLSAAAKEMGETTSFTAGDAAFALNALAQAGYTADEAIERLPKTLALAKAGGLDLASAAKIVTNSMASLNLSEKELDVLLDEMARTAQKSNTNIRELGESIKTVGGTMDMAGQSMETMFTELGMLANAGITASEAGTHLRNIMLSLAKTDVRGALHDMGVETVDTSGKIRDLCDIMVDLREVTKDMQSGELIETFGELFNVRDLASINALLNGTTGSMQALRTEIENSQGAAMQMSDTMSDNLAGDVTILRSALEGLQIAVSEKLNPSLRSATQHVTGLMGAMTESAKTGKLADDFERFGESLSKLITNGATLASDVLPTVIHGLTFVAEHASTILSIYVGIKAEAKAKALITSFTTLIGSVKDLRTSIVAAKAAQEGLNTAIAATPSTSLITIAATAVGILAGTLTKLALSIDVTNEKFAEASAEAKKFSEANQAVVESAKQAAQAHEDSIANLSSERDQYNGLIDKITELAEKESLTNAEHQELTSYIDELNAKIPGLNLSFNETTGELSKQKDELHELVNAYENYMEAQARTEYGVELAKQEIELQKAKDEAEKQFLEAQARKNELEAQKDELEKRIGEGRSGTSRRINADGTVSDLGDVKKQLEEVTEAYDKAVAELEPYSQAVTRTSEALRDNQAAQEENRKALDENTNSLANAGEVGAGLISQLEKGTSAMEKDTSATEKNSKATGDLTSKTNTYRSELGNLLGVLDKVNSSTAYSTSQILDLIAKYPELASAIRTAADGYHVEREAVEALTKAKAQELLFSARMELAQAKVKAAAARVVAGITGDTSRLKNVEKEIRNAEDLVKSYEKIASDISSGRVFSGSSSSSSSHSSGSSSSSSSSASSDKSDKYKQQAEAEISALEHEYKMGRLTAEDYYNALDELNRKFYRNKSEYLDDYRKYEEKVYAGLQKVQEEKLSNAKALEERLQAVKKAQDDLRNAENQQSNVYSSASGWHAERNSTAIEKAQQTLAEKQQSLGETLSKAATLSGTALDKLTTIDLRSLLPDLSSLRLPSTTSSGASPITSTAKTSEQTFNITYSPEISINGSTTPENVAQLKTELKDQFDKLMRDYIDREYLGTLREV